MKAKKSEPKVIDGWNASIDPDKAVDLGIWNDASNVKINTEELRKDKYWGYYWNNNPGKLGIELLYDGERRSNVHIWNETNMVSQYTDANAAKAFRETLEKALTGCQWAIRAVEIVVFYNPFYKDYKKTVKALKKAHPYK